MRASLLAGAAVALLACGGSSSSKTSETDPGSKDSPSGPTGGQTGPVAGGPCVDVQSDPYNCGACGTVCSPAHATPACAQGACARGVCQAGWFDLDGDAKDGCEASCDGEVCSAGGLTIALGGAPVPETGLVAGAFTSSGPADDGAPAQLVGALLGEATPLPDADPQGSGGDGLTCANEFVLNLVGFDALYH